MLVIYYYSSRVTTSTSIKPSFKLSNCGCGGSIFTAIQQDEMSASPLVRVQLSRPPSYVELRLSTASFPAEFPFPHKGRGIKLSQLVKVPASSLQSQNKTAPSVTERCGRSSKYTVRILQLAAQSFNSEHAEKRSLQKGKIAMSLGCNYSLCK